MKVRIAKSRKQPVLNSMYLSRFNNATLELLKANRPFTSYHKDLQEYEVTPEVYEKILEPVEVVLDERNVYSEFKRKHFDGYGYQQDTVEFARKTDNVLINFSQGMGKSLTTMKILLDEGIKRALIVCGQSNLQEEWVKDAEKHAHREELDMRIVGDDAGAGNAKKVKWLVERGTKDGVDLINIEALRVQEIVDALNARRYECVIVDEVQSAKGWKAEQTQGLHDIERTYKQKRIALSGTPVLNDPLEFFSLLRFFDMLEDTARTTFEKYYGEWGFDFWGHYICKGYRNFEDLNDLIKPILCSASKDELHLPTKTRKLIRLPWVSEEYMRLKEVYGMTDVRLKKAGYKNKPQVRGMMQRLSSTAQPKLDFVLEHSLNNRVLVFSQYTTVLDDYCQKLAEQGRKVLYYHGGLSMKERLEVLKKWREGDYDVLLLSVMAARYGLNLTEACETIFLDIPTSLAVLEQAEDRAHRIGQTKPVTSYLLCCSEIDQDMLDSIEQKQRFLDELVRVRG